MRLTKKAAGVESGGRMEVPSIGSDFDRVAALPVTGLGGNNRQTQFLADSAGEKAPYRMCLPVSRLHDFLQASSPWPVQQSEDFLGFAAPTRTLGFGRLFGRSGLCCRIRLARRDVGLECGWSDYRFAKALNGLPYPRNSRFSIFELLYGSATGEAIPDRDQPFGRPFVRKSGKRDGGSEVLRAGNAFCILRRRVRTDIVSFVFNRKGLHHFCPCPLDTAVTHSSLRLRAQASEFAGETLGRRRRAVYSAQEKWSECPQMNSGDWE